MEENIIDKYIEKNISTEIKDSFLDYSMSVIVSRAIPDVKDGLKPVHRRILYAMHVDGTTPDKAYRKSAQTVGTVMGKYHPHGDSAIYETMVRMAQDFSYRKTLIDGKGAFGSLDGSGAAAARYTEAKLAKISLEMLRDINKNSVNFKDTYDGSYIEPEVLPSRFPNVLVNGNMGIAVGMATNIPPHNLGESIDAVIAYVKNNDITIDELMTHIKGPDFPTGGFILGNSGIKKAYETGRGSIMMRALIEIEEIKGRNRIIIKEIPYQSNTTSILKKIAELVRDKQIEGISHANDESSLEGVKIVIDIKAGFNPNVILNNLYKHTQLQTSFGINFLMLVDGRPRTLNLKEILYYYSEHQKDVVIRRTKFDLEKALRRAHLLEGFLKAIKSIDEIIVMIKASVDETKLISDMVSEFGFSNEQAIAILEMRLKRLSGLEKGKLEDELAALNAMIDDLNTLLASHDLIYEKIIEELLEIKEKYNDDRKTHIDMTALEYIDDESLIPVENIVITLTNNGYIKRMGVENYRVQNRGGVGVKGITTNEDDDVDNLVTMTTHDYILFFSNKGKVYRLKGYEVPLYSRTAKGLPIVNLLNLDKDEEITALLKVLNDENCKYVIFCTEKGLVKRTELTEFSSIRNSGKIAISLNEDDRLIAVKKTLGNNEIVIGTSSGRMIRFDETEVRVMGRTAIGVKGIHINNDVCVGCEVVEEGKMILVVTNKGYGKKTSIEEYRKTKRGGKGVKTLNLTEKNGEIISVKGVIGDEDIILITDQGVVIRMKVCQVSTVGRVTQGVRLIDLKVENKVVAVTIIDHIEEEDLLDMEEASETGEE